MTRSPKDDKVERLVHKALVNSLNEFGEPVGETVLHILKRSGILVPNAHVSLASLRDVLVNLMGDAAAEIVLEQIIVELDRLHSEA